MMKSSFQRQNSIKLWKRIGNENDPFMHNVQLLVRWRNYDILDWMWTTSKYVIGKSCLEWSRCDRGLLASFPRTTYREATSPTFAYPVDTTAWGSWTLGGWLNDGDGWRMELEFVSTKTLKRTSEWKPSWEVWLDGHGKVIAPVFTWRKQGQDNRASSFELRASSSGDFYCFNFSILSLSPLFLLLKFTKIFIKINCPEMKYLYTGNISLVSIAIPINTHIILILIAYIIILNTPVLRQFSQVDKIGYGRE